MSVSTRAWDIAATVHDPELPVLTIDDLGILREVQEHDGDVVVTITPTYSGCPAMNTIRDDLQQAFAAAGYRHVAVETVLTPAWTTDWMSEDGKRKLREYGVAPPATHRAAGPVPLQLGIRARDVACPRCGSQRTRQLTPFGSTSCKALYECQSCLEPFDYFKVH